MPYGKYTGLTEANRSQDGVRLGLKGWPVVGLNNYHEG